jgi:hypothetical protein
MTMGIDMEMAANINCTDFRFEEYNNGGVSGTVAPRKQLVSLPAEVGSACSFVSAEENGNASS